MFENLFAAINVCPKLGDAMLNEDDLFILLLCMIKHYYMMLLTRHYDQRSFEETVCDALITNGDVKNPSKRCKMFAMEDASNTVQILVTCVMQGTGLTRSNCL